MTTGADLEAAVPAMSNITAEAAGMLDPTAFAVGITSAELFVVYAVAVAMWRLSVTQADGTGSSSAAITSWPVDDVVFPLL